MMRPSRLQRNWDKRVALHHAGALGHPQIALAQLANLDQKENRAIDLPDASL